MAVNIGPRIGIDGEAEYRAQINQIIQQAKTLDSEMRLVAASFTKDADAKKKNKETTAVLTKQIENQKDRVKALTDMLDKSAKEFGENDTKTLKWKQAVNEAAAELKTMENRLDSVGDEMEDTGKKSSAFADMLKANLLSDAISSGLSKFADLAGEAMRAFADFAKDGIQTASDLQEVQNVVDVTFGESAAAIDEFAKGAASAYGMSELSAKQYTGTMGAMLKSMGLTDDAVLDMSTSMAGLAGDMASFYNLDTDEAFAKLRAGISGETEPLKQLGINMSVANLEAYALAEGIETAYKDMSQAEQATLRYNYLMQATADAQGDFARTSDSYANQSRIMQLNLENIGAAIGTAVLPMVTEFTSALNELLSGDMDVGEFVSTITGMAKDALTSLSAQLPEFLAAGGEIIQSLLSGINDLLPLVVEIAVPIIGSLVMGLLDAMPELIEMGATLMVELAKGIADNLPTLLPAAVEAVVTIALGIVDAIPQLIGVLPQLFDAIFEAFGNVNWLELGADIMRGIMAGLESLLSALWDTVKSIARGIWDTLVSVFGREADSGSTPKKIVRNVDSAETSDTSIPAQNTRMMMRSFSPMPMVAAAEEKSLMSSGYIAAANAHSYNGSANAYKNPSTSSYGKGNSGGSTGLGGVVINVYASEGQDVRAIADEVMYRIDGAVSRREAVFA